MSAFCELSQMGDLSGHFLAGERGSAPSPLGIERTGLARHGLQRCSVLSLWRGCRGASAEPGVMCLVGGPQVGLGTLTVWVLLCQIPHIVLCSGQCHGAGLDRDR